MLTGEKRKRFHQLALCHATLSLTTILAIGATLHIVPTAGYKNKEHPSQTETKPKFKNRQAEISSQVNRSPATR